MADTSVSRTCVRGLNNIGNTCFFNSTIQCLASLQCLQERFAPIGHTTREGPITTQFRRYMMEMVHSESSRGAFSPADLLDAVAKTAPRFKGRRQQDAQELLRYLLDAMQEEDKMLRKIQQAVAAAKSSSKVDEEAEKAVIDALKAAEISDTKQEYSCSDEGLGSEEEEEDAEEERGVLQTSMHGSGAANDWISEYFGGRLMSVVVCKACETPSIHNDPFLDVSLPIPGTSMSHSSYGASKRRHQNIVYSTYTGESIRKKKKKKGKHGKTTAKPVVPAPAPAVSKIAQAATAKGPTAQLICPAIPPKFLATAGKEELGKFIQQYGRATMLTKLKITKSTKSALFKSLDRATMVGFIEQLQKERENQLAVLKAEEKPAEITANEATQTGVPAESSVATEIPLAAVVSNNDTTAAAVVTDVVPSEISEQQTPPTDLRTETTTSTPADVSTEPVATVTTSEQPVDSTINTTDAVSGDKTAATTTESQAPAPPATLPPPADDVNLKKDETTTLSAAEGASAAVNGLLTVLRTGGTLLREIIIPPEIAQSTNNTSDSSSDLSLATCFAAFSGVEQLSESAGNGYACGFCRKAQHAAPKPANGVAEDADTHKAATKDSSDTDEDDMPIVFTDALGRMLLSHRHLPRVLTVHLKRFAVSDFRSLYKVSTRVVFPELLDVTPYCSGGAAAFYRLVGVVVHSGGIEGGHYVAYVRFGKPASFTNDGIVFEPACGTQWMYMSDAHGHPVKLEDVLAAEAYLLFYERVHKAEG